MKTSTRVISISLALIIFQIAFAPDSFSNPPPCLGFCNKQWKECIKKCEGDQTCTSNCGIEANDCVKSAKCITPSHSTQQ